jgi:predicted dehydrogenase
MTSMGVHLIDTMHYLIGPIVRVMTMSRTGRDRTVDEATIMGFEFESGALATLATSFFTPSINEVAVFGTEGAAYNQWDGTVLSFQGRNEDRPIQIPVEPVDLIADQFREFALAIRGGAAVEVGGPEGLAVVAVMEAAIEAAASGRTVEVVSA